jgi:hypothetical protein
MQNIDNNIIEFIGNDGYHYKIINNRIYKIEHKVLRKDYYKELYKLERLKRNYYFPFLKNFERSNNIQPIRIKIIKKKKINCLFFNLFY